MLLFTIIMTTLAVIATSIVLAIIIGGSVMGFIFGDVIVCAVLFWFIFKCLFNKD